MGCNECIRLAKLLCDAVTAYEELCNKTKAAPQAFSKDDTVGLGYRLYLALSIEKIDRLKAALAQHEASHTDTGITR